MTSAPSLLSPIIRRAAPWFALAMLAFAAVWAFAAAPATPPAAKADDLPTLRVRAEAGDAEALNALGNAYATGAGIAQDYAQATKYYESAATKLNAAAIFSLGTLAETGRGRPASATAATGWPGVAGVS